MSDSSTNNFWLFLEALARRRSLIVALVILAVLAAVIISMLLPAWYEAETLLLPPKEVSMPVAGVSQLAEVVSVVEGLNLPVMVTASDVYCRILSSRTVCEHVIGSFDLAQRYETGNSLETYLTLLSHATFRVTEEGLLSIRVEDRDPAVAAAIANAFAAELDRLNREIATGRALQNRQFVEERVDQIRTQLDSARREFEAFQMTNRAVDFDEQTRLAIEQAIALKVDLARIEIDLRMNEQTLGKDNPELIEKRRRRQAIRDRLLELETGGEDSSYFSLPIASVPGLKGQYEVLYSRVKVNERLYNILLEQLEQAKLQENEELPTISILDHARVPELRSRPKRGQIVMIAAVLALLASVMLAMVLEYLRRLQQNNPDDYQRAMYFVHAFFGWLPGVQKAGKNK